jgi:hypothetical protein
VQFEASVLGFLQTHSPDFGLFCLHTGELVERGRRNDKYRRMWAPMRPTERQLIDWRRSTWRQQLVDAIARLPQRDVRWPLAIEDVLDTLASDDLVRRVPLYRELVGSVVTPKGAPAQSRPEQRGALIETQSQRRALARAYVQALITRRRDGGQPIVDLRQSVAPLQHRGAQDGLLAVLLAYLSPHALVMLIRLALADGNDPVVQVSVADVATPVPSATEVHPALAAATGGPAYEPPAETDLRGIHLLVADAMSLAEGLLPADTWCLDAGPIDLSGTRDDALGSIAATLKDEKVVAPDLPVYLEGADPDRCPPKVVVTASMSSSRLLSSMVPAGKGTWRRFAVVGICPEDEESSVESVLVDVGRARTRHRDLDGLMPAGQT